jgi:hypothetical protein
VQAAKFFDAGVVKQPFQKNHDIFFLGLNQVGQPIFT